MSSETSNGIGATLSTIFQKSRFVILGIAILGLLTTAGLVFFNMYQTGVIERASKSLEKVVATATELASTSDEATKTATLETFNTQLQSLRNDFPGTYQAQKSYILEAAYYSSKEDWTKAEELYLTASQMKNSDVLAAASLFNAATSAESRGDNAKAIEYLNSLISNYSGLSPEVPRALFNLGRLAEASSKTTEAMDFYQQIIDKHADSDWTKVALDRILFLKARAQ